MLDSTADTILKWAFWMGAGFAAVQVFDKLARKPALEMNPGGRYIVYVGDSDGNPLVKDSSFDSLKKAKSRAAFVFTQYPVEPRHGGMTVEIVDTHDAEYDGSSMQSWMIEQDFHPVEKLQERFVRSPSLAYRTIAERAGLPVYVVRYWDNDAVFEKKSELDSFGKLNFTLRRRRKPLPEGLDIREQVLEMYEPGMNIEALSRYLKVSSENIKRWLIREGIYVPSRRISHAARVRISRGTQNPEAKYLAGTPAAWEMNPTKEEKAILLRRALELYEPGSNISQLAGYLNMSVATLTNWLKKEGVYVSSRFSRYKKFNAARRKANKRLKILRESYGVSATPIVSVDAAEKECTFNGYDIPRIDDKDFRKKMRLLSAYTAKELPPYIAQHLAIAEGDIDAAMIYIAKSRNMEGTILFLLGEARFYKEKELARFLLCTGVKPPDWMSKSWETNPEPYAFGGW